MTGTTASWQLRATRVAATAVLLGVGALALSACPGELDDPEVFANSCAAVDPKWFPQTCAFDTCHNHVSLAGGLDLLSPGIADRVLNQPGSQSCGGKILADPGNPKGSLLYLKLTSSPGCGVQMPKDGTAFTEQELECVASWIGSLSGSGAGGN